MYRYICFKIQKILMYNTKSHVSGIIYIENSTIPTGTSYSFDKV